MIADGIGRSRVRMSGLPEWWHRTLGWSLLLHGAVLILAVTWSGMFAGRASFGPVYDVELVSLPAGRLSGKGTVAAKAQLHKASPREKAIPIQRFQAKEEALSLKKRQGAVPSKQESEEELLSKALAKIERPKEPTPAERRGAQTTPGHPQGVAATEAQGTGKGVSLVNIGGMKGDELSQALALYRALIYEKIESNWVLPDRMMLEKKGLEAVVAVRTHRDGTVTDIRFEKKSGDAYFDDSVLKAIVKSKPFPPFPDIYSPKEEDIVIRFAPGNERS
jgi:colicin import membrane protein